VLVIQAAARSGTLITAGFAGDQGRDVWAVPGPPEDARARGTNWLIRQGARLVERPQEVLEDLLPSQAAASGAQEDRPHEETQALGTLAEEERGLLASLDHQPVDIDSLAARTGVPVTRASSLLLSLELSGRVRQVAGMRFVKIG
jgi:DNA processing protein